MLSVIAVNHNSSALLKRCYFSIASTVAGEPFEFFAVDSGSREEELSALTELDTRGMKLILSRDNIGYAGAVNLGLKQAKGDFLLITNPDVLYKPGSIEAMVDALAGLPLCGAVIPKTWWNDNMTFLLPVSEPITPLSVLGREFMRLSRITNEGLLRRWVKRTVRCWLSETPVRLDMPAGASVMTTREVIEKVGGFDEMFTLYFEDTDWFMRVKKARYRIYMLPQAQIVHYYNQSAKQDAAAAQEKFDDSFAKYIGKHFKSQAFLLRLIGRLRKYGRNSFADRYNDLGVLEAPPTLHFRHGLKKLILISPVDPPMPAAGSFIEGDSFEIPRDLWNFLWEGRCYVRAFEFPGLIPLGAWTWIHSPGNE